MLRNSKGTVEDTDVNSQYQSNMQALKLDYA